MKAAEGFLTPLILINNVPGPKSGILKKQRVFFIFLIKNLPLRLGT
jgi:hypothetical protein